MTALEQLTGPAAVAVAGAGIAAGALTLAVARRPLLALGVLLDLLLAAGLLRLAGDPDWGGVVTAAAIVALRRLISGGVRAAGHTWASGPGRPRTGRRRPPLGHLLFRPAWRA